jgi:predicted dehydrogenase
MQKEEYGVLLVSFSKHSHQRNFVELYQANPRTRIVAVSDESDVDDELKAINQQWAAELSVPYIEGVDQALQRDDVDIVSIGHEIERRADLSIRAAQAGKHLWIDKFVGATIDQCDAVVEKVEAAGVKSIIPSYTYSELVRQSHFLLASGELGDLLGLHVDILFGKSWPRPLDESQLDHPLLPPGRWKFPDIKRELLTVGAYAVGLIQTCFDSITHVHGQGGAYFFPEHVAHHADDFGTMTLTDKAGRIATLCGGRTGVASHPAGGPSTAHLIGSKGSAMVDGKRPHLHAYMRDTIVHSDYRPAAEDPMQWASGPPGMTAGMAADSVGFSPALDDLVRAIDADDNTYYTVRQARDHMEILIAGYLSIVRGAPVSLPLQREVH